MSTREMAFNILDRMTEKQLESFVQLFSDYVEDEEIPSDRLLAAFAEEDEMRNNPEKYKRYSDIGEMMRDALR